MQLDQNLASSQLGALIVFATDEWFAAADNMLSDTDPVWKQDLYTSYGKWMDGWESRRRRTEGHDWSIIKLGFPGTIKAIEVDTAYFTGNFSPKISIYGTHIDENDKGSNIITSLINLRESSIVNKEDHSRIGLCATEEENTLVSQLQSHTWSVLLPLTPLGAGYEETRKTLFKITSNSTFTHLRVNMGPDGGIARIRVYGNVVVNPNNLLNMDKPFDLISIQYGGQAISWSNKHYGHPRNLMAPGRGTCMGDGWETARQPARPAIYQKGPDGLMLLPGYDWALLKLGVKGVALSLEIDTHYYKGNYPESCMILACNLNKDYSNEELNCIEDVQNQIISNNGGWKVLLPRTRLYPDQIHHFNLDTTLNNTYSESYLNNNSNNNSNNNINNNNNNNNGPITHIKLIIYPDGGIMRLRVMGHKFLESKL